MKQRPKVNHRLFLLLLASLLGIGACSSSPIVVDKPLDPTQEKLIKIGAAYVRFAMDKGRPPKGPEEIRPILAQSGSPDDILVSSRDGQPLVICWGVDILKPAHWAKSTPVLAYEKQGVDGTHYVLTTVRSVERLSEQQFREASFPPGHSPAF